MVAHNAVSKTRIGKTDAERHFNISFPGIDIY